MASSVPVAAILTPFQPWDSYPRQMRRKFSRPSSSCFLHLSPGGTPSPVNNISAWRTDGQIPETKKCPAITELAFSRPSSARR